MAKNLAATWLSLEDDDAGVGSGYDSEAIETSHFNQRRKRRRLSTDREDLHPRGGSSKSVDTQRQQEIQSSDVPLRPSNGSPLPGHFSPDVNSFASESSIPRSTSKAKASGYEKRSAKTGVIYLSRIPPFLKPSALKSLLSPYGDIGRVFLTPEEPSFYAARVKSGGNKKRSFTDGWVEFKRKRDAKLVAETLNAQSIGGKKGGWYRDDVWNIKYLKGFKWRHLTEQISNENAERAARLRTEIALTKKENKRFATNVEKAKMLDAMQQKRRAKIGEDASRTQDVEMAAAASSRSTHFQQVEVKRKGRDDEKPADAPASVKRVLSQIF